MRRKTTKETEQPKPLPPSRRGGKGGPRELSITALWRASANARAGGEHVPYVRISGRWLEQFGFARGARIVVAAEQGRLGLTIAERPRCS